MNEDERAELIAAEDEFLGLIRPFLRRAWCRETASPYDQKDWSHDNPAKGQCAVTARLIQRLLGGDMLGGRNEAVGSHYWNLLPSGREIDETWEQFPEGTEKPPGVLKTVEYALDSEGAIRARTRERHDLLWKNIRSLMEDMLETIENS